MARRLYDNGVDIRLNTPVTKEMLENEFKGYEVIAGSLATNKQFTGLVLRTEEIFTATTAGYIDYYANEGAKVSNSTIVYSVDESGRMSEYLEENSADINLSEEHYSSLKSEISAFSNGYEKLDFSEIYDFHDTMNGNILELSNQTLLSEMEALAEENATAFQRVYGAKSGIVGYHIDGYEAVTPETITPEMFDKSTYEATNLISVDLISSGDPVYKLVTDENWTVIVPMTEEQIQEIAYKQVTDENGNITTYSVVGIRIQEIPMKQSSGEYTVNIAKGYYIVRIADTVRKVSIR